MPDPYQPQSLNRYAYVLGDPVNLVDPTGNFSVSIGVGFGTISFSSATGFGFSPGFSLGFGFSTGAFLGDGFGFGLFAGSFGAGGFFGGSFFGSVPSFAGPPGTVYDAKTGLFWDPVNLAAVQAGQGTGPSASANGSYSDAGDVGIQFVQAGGQSSPFSGGYFDVRPPDADGYLTLGEATWQWRNGLGAPAFVDLNTLDLSAVRASDFAGPGSKLLFPTKKPWDFLVHGSITLQLNPNGTVSALADTYNFDMKPWSVQTFLRNIEAWTGARYAGPGQQFDVHFRGSVAVRP